MSEEEIIEENIRRYIKEHSTTIKAYTQKYVDDLQNQLQQKDKEIEKLNNIVNKIKKYFEDLEIFVPSRDIKYDILDIIEGSDKE